MCVVMAGAGDSPYDAGTIGVDAQVLRSRDPWSHIDNGQGKDTLGPAKAQQHAF